MTASEAIYRAVGKGYLTDDQLIDDTCRFFDTVEGEGKGRAAWHMMSGLPTERPDEILDLLRVLSTLNARRRGKTPRNLSIHWQPFQPLPGTPMQWCAAGGGARKLAGMLMSATRFPWMPVRHVTGRTDELARLCTILSRSDERGADLIDAYADGRISVEEARQITGTTDGALDPDTPLPWDFVQQWQPTSVLRKAYDVMMRRLQDPDGAQ